MCGSWEPGDTEAPFFLLLLLLPCHPRPAKPRANRERFEAHLFGPINLKVHRPGPPVWVLFLIAQTRIHIGPLRYGAPTDRPIVERGVVYGSRLPTVLTVGVGHTNTTCTHKHSPRLVRTCAPNTSVCCKVAAPNNSTAPVASTSPCVPGGFVSLLNGAGFFVDVVLFKCKLYSLRHLFGFELSSATARESKTKSVKSS